MMTSCGINYICHDLVGPWLLEVLSGMSHVSILLPLSLVGESLPDGIAREASTWPSRTDYAYARAHQGPVCRVFLLIEVFAMLNRLLVTFYSPHPWTQSK